jgi:hypothetical protein
MLVEPSVITWADGSIAVFYPVRCARMGFFQVLMNRLIEDWQLTLSSAGVLSKSAPVIRAINDLLPDEPLFPLCTDQWFKQENEPLFQVWFLAQLKGDEVCPSKLVEIHTWDSPKKLAPKEPDAEMTAADLPFPTSGNYLSDQIAVLAQSFSGGEALALTDALDPRTLKQISYTLNELNRPTEERIQENLAQRFSEWKNRNPFAVFGPIKLSEDIGDESNDS